MTNTAESLSVLSNQELVQFRAELLEAHAAFLMALDETNRLWVYCEIRLVQDVLATRGIYLRF